MPKQSLAHAGLEWSKHKLDEIDATLASVEESVAALKSNARQEADRAIARIQAAQKAFKTTIGAAQTEATAVRGLADDAYAALADVELGFQEVLTAAAGQADVVKRALAARVEAQRKSWQSSLDSIRTAVSDAVDEARAEVDASIQRLDAETEKARATLGEASTAGDESWKAVKSGLEEIRSTSDRTWKKIRDALAKFA